MADPGVERMLLALAAGDQRAYEQLYDRFAVRLYRAALAMLRRPEDAEDVVQEVFMAVVRSREKMSQVRDLPAYLFTALRHVAGRVAARRARQPVNTDPTIAETLTDKQPSAGSDPRGERLQRALGSLPPEQREVIALKIDGELTFSQIADVLDINANTAASRYRYAIEKLRCTLKGELKGESR